jgi:cytochrome P450
MSQILWAAGEDTPLTDDEFKNFFTVLMIAGQEASRHSISHGTLALLEHPDQLQRLVADPGMIDSATEEIIRWATPIYQFRRTATEDVPWHARIIKAGDKVTIWYISANFDETRFADPTRFDLGRQPNDHVSFGKGGPHYCLGASLARLQVKITFQEMLPLLPRMTISGPVERLRSNFIHGLKHLPLTISG